MTKVVAFSNGSVCANKYKCYLNKHTDTWYKYNVSAIKIYKHIYHFVWEDQRPGNVISSYPLNHSLTQSFDPNTIESAYLYNRT